MSLTKYTRTAVLLLLFFTVNSNLSGQISPATAPPKLGYALSGGGAKGLAHIGVLQILEANNIMPDYLTGTSMGSIVGGLYAMGYTPDEMIELATSLDWEYYFIDNYPRSYLPIEERSKADRYQLSFAIENGGLVIPKGLIGGKKILNLLGGITAPVHTKSKFDQYYLPFRCVATDLETGEAYVFKDGALRHGIRASMSIPSAFEPLLYDNHLLVDGMLVRNLPVQDAIEMGADIVLGVDVGSPLYTKDELNSVLKVLEQSSSYGMVKSTIEQRSLANMLIDPDLTGYTTLSYDSVDSLIDRGRQAAIAALPSILHQLDSLGWTATPKLERPPLRKDSFLVNEIFFAGDDIAAKHTLEQLVNISTPSIVTIDQLSKITGLLYSSGFFSQVDYEFGHTDGGGYSLYFTAKGTPDYYLKLGLNYDFDYKAALLLNFTARNKMIKGSLFSSDFRISEHPGVWLDYLIYTKTQPSVGIQLKASAQIIPGKKYENEELVDEFTFQSYRTGLHLQASLSRQWHAKAGIEGLHFSENPRFFTLDNKNDFLSQWFVVGQLIRDTYDRSYFPKDGSLTHIWGQLGLSGNITEVGGNEQTTHSTNGDILLGGKLHKAFSISSKLWLDFSLGAGASRINRDHLLQRFYLGREAPENPRFFEVYGFQQTELMPSAFGYGRLQLRTQIGQSNYIGIGYNYGLWTINDNTNPIEEGTISGLGLELGSITPLGPLRFTAEYNLEFERFNFSFFAGYRF